MPRTLWKGAVSFGLVTIPVRVYGATETKDLSFRQVHPADGGRIRYKRVCEVCGQEIPFAEIAKGYEAADGRMAILTDEDFAGLPAAEGKTVEVVQFVELEQIDPLYYDKSYVLEADGPGAKPYALLRQALADTDKAAVVRVALRGRESLALIRPIDQVLVLHTMLWPDEVRDLSFAAPPETSVTDAEVGMARLFIEQLSADFDPDAFTDTYREELEKVVAARLEGVDLPEGEEAPRPAEVVDLVAALRASVEAAKRRREAEAS
ncbi:MAG: Ku protein [Propionicimonas sp.]